MKGVFMADNTPQFRIETVYLFKFTFAAAKPAFTYGAEWKPEASVELESKHQDLEKGMTDVMLDITIKVKQGKTEVFQANCHQGGVFLMQNFAPEQKEEVIKCHCLNILFPYARQQISDAIIKAGFPPLHINPIDFYSQYQQHKKQEKTQKTAEKS
jgi:preprotein translocase subunit SecB